MVVLEEGSMLTTGHNQYLQPDYLSPLPTTVSTAFSVDPPSNFDPFLFILLFLGEKIRGKYSHVENESKCEKN